MSWRTLRPLAPIIVALVVGSPVPRLFGQAPQERIRAKAADVADAELRRAEAAAEAAATERQRLLMAVAVDGGRTAVQLLLEESMDKGEPIVRIGNVDELVSQLVFSGFPGALEPPSLMGLLDKQVDEIGKVCRLSKDLEKKLRLAGEGDVRRFDSSLDPLRTTLKEPVRGSIRDQETHRKVAELAAKAATEAAPARGTISAGLFGEGSLFRRILDRNLTAEQLALLKRAEIVKQALRTRQIVNVTINATTGSGTLVVEYRDIGQGTITLGPQDVAILIGALGDPDREVASRAATGLVHLGRPALDPLVEALDDPDVAERSQACNALGGMRHPRVPTALARRLYDAEKLVRDCAAHAMMRLAVGDLAGTIWRPEREANDPQLAGKSWREIDAVLRESVIAEFIAALRSGDEGARLAAAEKCRMIRANEMIPALAECLASPDRDLRKLAAATLASTHHDDAIAPLIAALGDLQKEIREIACDGLRYQVQIGTAKHDERVLMALIGVMNDPSPNVCGSAALALGAVRARGYEQALPHLLRATYSPRATVVPSAIDGLAALGDRRAIDRLFELTGDLAYKKQAAVALARLGDPRAAGFLRAALPEGDYGVVAALGELRDRESVPALIELLGPQDAKGPKAHLRSSAANALAAIGDDRAVEPLIELAATGDLSTSQGATTALGRLGDSRAIRSLLEICRNEQAKATAGREGRGPGEPGGGPLPENPSQSQIAWALLAIRYASVEPLGRALNDPSERVRAVAAWVLYNLTLQGGLDREDMQPAIEPLVDALDDPTEIVRFHAAMALGNVQEPRAVPTLLQAIVVKSPTYHYGNAAGCLSRMGGPASIEPLIGLLGHASPEGRLNAVRSLVRTREPRVVEALLPLLDDADASVRAATIRTLGFFQAPPPGEAPPQKGSLPRNERLEARLPELLRDDDWAVREAAAGTLGRVGGSQAADKLATLAGDPSSRVRVAAGAGLLRLGDARGVAIIEQALGDPNQEQREQAATSVMTAWIEDEALVPALARNLFDPAHNVRVTAISSLGRIANAAAAEALLDKANDREFLTAVVGALGRIRDPRAAEAVVRHLADYDPRVRAAAATALGESGDAEASARLTACLSDPATEVRVAAILALTKRKAPEAVEPLAALAKDDPNAGVRTAAERAVRRIER